MVFLRGGCEARHQRPPCRRGRTGRGQSGLGSWLWALERSAAPACALPGALLFYSYKTSSKKLLADDGVWMVADIKAHDGYEANVERNPMAALMYGTSVLTCLSSALSEPGGLGLGTLGLHEQLARQLAAEAGFASFERLELDHPVNAFYVARP